MLVHNTVDLVQILFSLLWISSWESDNNWEIKGQFLGGLHDSLGDSISFHNSTKYINKYSFYLWMIG